MQIDKYEKRVRNNVAESTLTSRLSALRRLEKFIGGGDPDIDNVEDWIDHLIDLHEAGEIKSSTIREYYKAAKYYFAVVKREDEALDHISKWIPKSDSDPGDHLTEEEWEELRNSVKGYRDKAFMELMYFYARRPTEVILLNDEDIHITEGGDEPDTIKFNILKKPDRDTIPLILSGGEEYNVMRATFELEKEPKQHLQKWLEYKSDQEEVIELDGEEKTVHPVFCTSHGRISYNSIYKMIKKTARRAAINKNVTPKAMGRHSRATHLDWAGKAPGNIGRDVLLHDPDTDVVGRYVHERGEDDVRDIMTIEGDEKE